MTHRVLKPHRCKMSVIYIYIYVVKKTDSVPSQLLPFRQWPHGYSCTWAHDVRLHIAGTNEPKSAQQFKQGAKQNWLEVTHDTQSTQTSQK